MLEVADILRRYGDGYLQKFGDKMLPRQRRAFADMLNCRTPVMGGHVFRCDQCGHGPSLRDRWISRSGARTDRDVPIARRRPQRPSQGSLDLSDYSGRTRDRFLLVFGKTQPKKVLLEEDPFVAGPVIPKAPGRWLERNYWRLRGLKTADERFILLRTPGKKGSVEKVPSGSLGKEIWKIPKEKLVLYFEKEGEKYLLTDYRSLDQR